jgi:membrane-bound lytic murein transglycosylase B
MLRLVVTFLISAASLCVAAPTLEALAAPVKKKQSASKRSPRPAHRLPLRSPIPQQGDPSPYRGWDYLVSRLQDNGAPEHQLRAIYGDPRMPERSFVPFSVKPREPSSIYESFKRPEHAELGVSFIQRNWSTFQRAENQLQVPKEVVAAIIVVESQAGKNTGNHLVLYRLSRLATTNAPDNLQQNYVEQKKLHHQITFSDVRRRGNYLERTFLPEISSLLSLAQSQGVDIFSIKGSSAGAMGLPQFLPSALLRFGVDGNRDGSVSLHQEADAIWSAANYLAHFGFRETIPFQEKRAIIWRYNKSKSYIDTVLSLSRSIDELNSSVTSLP